MSIEDKLNSLNPANRDMATQLIEVISLSQENTLKPDLTDVDIFLADTDRLDRMAESVGATLKEEFRK